MRKAAPENETDIETIARLLKAASIGATVTYEAMTDAIGRDIQDHRHLLLAAQRRTEEEIGALFGTVRGEGVKRLPSDEVASVGSHTIRRIRRAARRGMQRLTVVRANDLPMDDARKIIAQRSQLGAIALVSDNRSTPAIQRSVDAMDGTTVPAGRVLDLFKAKTG